MRCFFKNRFIHISYTCEQQQRHERDRIVSSFFCCLKFCSCFPPPSSSLESAVCLMTNYIYNGLKTFPNAYNATYNKNHRTFQNVAFHFILNVPAIYYTLNLSSRIEILLLIMMFKKINRSIYTLCKAP